MIQDFVIQGCSKKITRLKNIAKYGLELPKWNHDTSMDAQDNGELENVGFRLIGHHMVEHWNVFGGT